MQTCSPATPGFIRCLVATLPILVAAATRAADVPYPPPLTVAEGEKPEGEFVLAGPGAKTVIVIGDPDPPKFTFPYWGGERILQRFLEAVTGIKVPIVHHAKFAGDPKLDTPETFRIFVGRQPALDAAIGTELDALDDDASMIVARGRDLYICGKRYWGTHWAAYDLLERAAGCRWYLDEPRFWEPVKDGIAGIGDILPKAERVVVPANTRIVETPGYRTRWFMRTPAHSFRLRYRDRFVHNMEHVFDPAKYGKDHPDWYPLVKGTRKVPGPGEGQQFQPCVSNPGTVERAAEAAAEAFEKGEQCFGLGMNDSDVYCECEKCAAIAPAAITEPKQRIAYAFADWYNRVATRLEKKYPDRRIGTLAYGVLSLVPPGSIRLHPMVVPYLTRDSAQLFDPPEQVEFRELVDRWAKIATRMGIYEYIYGHGFYVPRLYDRYLLPNIKSRYGVGCESFYAEAGPQWALDGPKYWLVAKLAWNPGYRIEDLKTDFHKNMFGPAAAEMRAYFDFLEETWCTQTLEGNASNYRWMTNPVQFEIFTPEKCAAALALLDKAAAKAAGDGSDREAIRRRIDFFRNGISFTRRMSLRHAGDVGLRKLVARPDGPPPAEALPLLEGWLEGGPVSAIYALKEKVGLDTTAPNSLADFRYQWARDPAPLQAIHLLAKRATAEALDGLADRSPAGIRMAVDAAVGRMRGELGGAKAERALALVADVASAGGTLVVRGGAAGPAPTIDGTIDAAEWGAPAYAGRFFVAYAADERSPHETKVYARGTDGKSLFLAFDCEGDPALVGGDATDREASVGTSPKMVNDDAIAINFTKPGHTYFVAAFNAVGGVRAPDGVESAARKTDRGWQLEVKLPLAVATAAQGDLCLSRYERVPTADGKGTTGQCTTLRPVGRAGNTIGNGNFANLMAFTWGVTVVPEASGPGEAEGR